MRTISLALLAVCALFAGCARANQAQDAQQLLRESLNQLQPAGRKLLQGSSATSIANGGNSASATAVAGPGVAYTSQNAQGPGSTVSGTTQVGQKVDTCQRGPANSAACQTLTTADRSSGCTDIAPSTQFTCAEQAGFGKCDADFIFMGAYCLKSCNRCGGNCSDNSPPGGTSCATSQCNSTAITAGPYCLKTCGRCSSAS